MAAAKKKGGFQLGQRSGPMLYSDDNDREILTCVVPRQRMACLPTTDPHDRAHRQRDAMGHLVPSAKRGAAVRGVVAKPRRYHLSQLVGWRFEPVDGRLCVKGGVGVDSSFDGWWETYRELVAAGVPLGGMRFSRMEEDAARADLYMPADMDLRDRLEPLTRQSGMTAEEIRLEREASRMIGEAQ